MWVEEGYRQKGVAQSLVREFESTLHKKGIYRVELTVDTQNAAAKELWAGSGFAVYQERLYKVI